MTLALVRNELNRFLAEPSAEVLAIRGKWGVGKTYSWNRILEDANRRDRISRKRYAYLSLFGIGTLDELRFSLFEQSINRSLIGKPPTLDTFRDNASQLSMSLGRKAWRLVSSTPYMKSVSPALEAVSFFSIRDMLICLDDLERRSESLSARDVLGLVSLLKEQRNCKVVLLLNDGEDGLEDFEKYREKVVDVELLFDPTAKECSEIAFHETTPLYQSVGELSERLGITNIRTLKKIERLVGLVESRLSDLGQDVTHQVLHSLVLYGWCHYRADDPAVPPLDYVQNIGYVLFGLGGRDDLTDDEKAWNTKLQNYGYQVTDELDEVLANAVRTGYVVDAEFDEAAWKKNQQVIAAKATGSFSDAWRTYHESFNNDQDAVVKALYESFKLNAKHVTPTNLNGTVCLFRELGEDAKADEIIDFYVDIRADEPELFNLDDYPFAGDISDAAVREAFGKAYEGTQVPEPVKDVLLRLCGSNGWSDKDEVVLANVSVDEYYELFKAENGRHLTGIINACLRFGQFSNASERQKKIAADATEALVRIGNESAINARRVKKFGVEVDSGA
ncbi:hypothetical protein [uncultured Salinisphaera sp.]|uniref:hypothetical protein n=1 Tax=uncultured Salinisphaera sp. TaxID=359372 RepID=UPI0032B2FB8D